MPMVYSYSHRLSDWHEARREERNMYRIYLINQFYFMDGEFASLDAAIAAGKNAFYEFAVMQGDRLIASWGAFSGTRYYT